MAQGAGGPKRKRPGDRQDSYNGRPSPHRPDELSMAQQSRRPPPNGPQGQQSPTGYGGRGGRRGRGGGYHQQQQQHHNAMPQQPRQEEPPMSKSENTAPQSSQNNGPPRVSSPAPPAVSSPAPAQAPPQQRMPQIPSQPLEPPPPPKPPSPYDYEVLTDDKVGAWKDAGRAAVISQAVEALQSDDPSHAEETLQELVRAGLDAKLDALEAGRVVADILEALPEEAREDASNIFLDNLAIITDNDLENARIPALLFSTNIPPAIMRLHLDDPLMTKVGMVRGTFHRIMVRKQTHLLYKQSNYNLLREEPEGYSKLATELFTTTFSSPDPSAVGETFENIKALVGAFDLDAGRVLDITLDVFANLLVKHYRFFVKLLRQSSWWPPEQNVNGLQTRRDDFGSLPSWAQPGYSTWHTRDEDRSRIAKLKLNRDRMFWDNAREIGLTAFFELGGRQVVQGQDTDALLKAAAKEGDAKAAEQTRQWIESTGTMPPAGNSVAAQLLGFKLRFYSHASRDPHDNLPVNLIYLAALLIKIGFISLKDLNPHIWPEDNNMEELKERLAKEKVEREQAKRPGGGTMNALSRAGALADDTMPAPAVSRLRDQPSTRASTPSKSDETATRNPAEDTKERLPEPKDQKVELLRSLLAIGAIPESLYMLGRFPWLIDGYPDLVEHIHRILHQCLSGVYQRICPLTDRPGLQQAARPAESDQGSAARGEIRLLDPAAPKVMKWAKIDKKDVEGTDFEYYWHDWADNVPVCQTVDDVFTLCSTLMNLTGVKIGQDSSLMMKLSRIGKRSLAEDASESNRTRWHDLCKRLLIPALSLTGCNPAVVNEMFDLLKFFDTPTRFAIYSEWFLGSTSRVPDITSAFELARAETKDTMKRVSKTNIRPMARQLAKVACASPGVVFQIIFNQIESYTNLIDVVVDCGRYFTYMSYDVLTWSLLTALGRAGRSRMSSKTGIDVSLWLLALSQFTGRIYKRYAMMDTSPILQYILAQLQQNNNADLQVLRELCANMGGIATDTDFNEAQVQAMAGGDLLQSQTLRQVLDKRHESRTPGRRLTRTLADHDLAAPLLIAIAQQRQMCIFSSEQNQVKAVAENFDGIHIVLQQFLELLQHNLSVKDFKAFIPDVPSLIADFGLDPSVAFMMQRKTINKTIEEYNATHKTSSGERSRSSSDAQSKKDTVMAETTTNKVEGDKPSVGDDDAEKGNSDALTHAQAAPVIVEPEADDGNADAVNVNSDVKTEVESAAAESPWHPIMQELVEKMGAALPGELLQSISLPFFVSFWQLSINDLILHTQSYSDEQKRQTQRIAALNADRSDPSSAGVRKRSMEKKQIQDLIEKLTDEMKQRISQHRHVRLRLEKEKAHWFDGFGGRNLTMIPLLLQECFLPRMMMSPLDSYYCWRMLNFMHSSGTPGFRTIHFIDAFMSQHRLANIMFQCTGREAENFGRFLYELLKELNTWHAERSEYEKRAWGPKKQLPGFAAKYNKDGEPEKLLEFESFRQLLYKWHSSLQKAAKFCIDSGEYMQMKNAIVVLKSVGRVYPAVNWMGLQLCESLKPYLVAPKDGGKEQRDDVRVLSNSLMGLLKSKEKTWVLPQAFRSGGTAEDGGKSQKSQSRQASQAPKSPQPVSRPTDNRNLNAQTAEFRPHSASNAANNLPSRSATPSGRRQNIDTVISSDSSKDDPGRAATAATETPRPAPQDTSRRLEEMRAKLTASRRESQPSGTAAPPDLANGPRPPQSSDTPRGKATPMRDSRTGTPASNQQPAADPLRSDTVRNRSTPSGPERSPSTAQQRDRYPARDTQQAPQHMADRDGRVNGMGPPSRYDALGRESFRDARQQGGQVSRDDRRMANGRMEPEDRHNRTDDRLPRQEQQVPPSTSASTETGHRMDPGRAALLAEAEGRSAQQAPSNSTPRSDREAFARTRPHSPTRVDQDRHAARDPQDDRQGFVGRPPPADPRGPPPRAYPTDSAPNGPRGSGPSRNSYPNESGRAIDRMGPPDARPDRGRGGPRFEESSRVQPNRHDENYGRLNANDSIPASPAQSPPVTRRGEMNGVPMQPQAGRRQSVGSFSQPPVSPAKDRMPPSRGPPPASPALERPSSATDEAPGIHPSRLGLIEQQAPPAARPPPLQTQGPAASPTSAYPPSGPRSATLRGSDAPPHSPAGPRPGPPMGPAGGDRRRESGQGPNDRRFAGIQDTLASTGRQQTRGGPPPSGPGASMTAPQMPSGPATPNDQGISIRGGANAMPPQYPSQQPQQSQAQQPMTQQRPPSTQQDLFAQQQRGGPPPQGLPPQAPQPYPSGRDTPTSSSDRLDARDRGGRDRDQSGRSDRDRERGSERDTRRSGLDSGRASHRGSRESSRDPRSERDAGRDARRGGDRDLMDRDPALSRLRGGADRPDERRSHRGEGERETRGSEMRDGPSGRNTPRDGPRDAPRSDRERESRRYDDRAQRDGPAGRKREYEGDQRDGRSGVDPAGSMKRPRRGGR